MATRKTKAAKPKQDEPRQVIMFTMEHRLLLVNMILPQTGGSLDEALRIRALRRLFSLSKEEQEKIGLRMANGGAQWNRAAVDAAGAKPFDLLPADRAILAKSFQLLVSALEEKKAPVPADDAFLDLYDMFAGEEA